MIIRWFSSASTLGSQLASTLRLILVLQAIEVSVLAVTFTSLDVSFSPNGPPPQVSMNNPAIEAVSAMFPNGLAAPPTNAWWTTWTQLTGGDDETAAIDMQPYLVKVLPRGLRIASPHDMSWDGECANGNCVKNVFNRNVSISTIPVLNDVKVEAFDDLSVTFVWRATSSGPVAMRATLLQGSPYVTVDFVGVQPVFQTFNDGWLGNAPSRISRDSQKKFRISCSSSLTWFIYSSDNQKMDVAATASSVTATGPTGFTGRWRVATHLHQFAIPYGWTRATLAGQGAAFEAVLDAYASVYPTGGSVQLGIQDAAASPTGKARAILQYSFATATMFAGAATELLMFAMPHHREHLVLPAAPSYPATSTLTCKGTRGNLVTVPTQGYQWQLAFALPDITWAAPNAITDANTIQAITQQLLETDVNSDLYGAQVYKVSQQLADMGRIARIATELSPHNASLNAAASTLLQRIRTYLGAWLTPTSLGSPPTANNFGLVYDSKWRGIISYYPVWINAQIPGAGRNEEDKNNAYWHHLSHYGPFIYAAAVLAKADASWSATNKAAVLALVRDIANPRKPGNDSYFPSARYMDWWAGHAWATGLAKAAVDGAIKDWGKWQECAGAAVNAYYTIALFGDAVGDIGLQRWGQVLAAIDAGSARTYWQIPTGGSEAYPVGTFVAANGGSDVTYMGYANDGKRVPGKISQSRVKFMTEVGNAVSEPVVLYGLQWGPFLPGASDLLHQGPWVQDSYAKVASSAIASADATAWAAFRSMARAYSDPAGAWSAALAGVPANSPNQVDATDSNGLRHSKTSVLYWIATRGVSVVSSPPLAPPPSSSPPPSPSPLPIEPPSSPSSSLPQDQIPYTRLNPNISTSAPPGLASYTNTYHTYWDGTQTATVTHDAPLPGNFFPHPTNSWWSPWIHTSQYGKAVGDVPVTMHPWRIKALQLDFVEVVPPGIQWDVQPGYIVPAYDRFLRVTAAEGITGRSVPWANELGVTFQWAGADGAAAGGTLTMTMLQGSPFLTMRYAGLSPVVYQHPGAPLIEGTGTFTGSRFVVANNAGLRFKYYFSSSVTVAINASAVVVQAPFTGVLRIALLYSPLLPIIQSSSAAANEQLYDANCDIYPTGATLDYGYRNTADGTEQGVVRIVFATASMSGSDQGQLMMLAMPHHRAHLLFPPQPTGTLLRLDDLRGELTHVLGSDWYLGYDLQVAGIAWDAPQNRAAAAITADATIRTTLFDTLVDDAYNWQGRNPTDSTYQGSAELAALGRMAVIADEAAAAWPADAGRLQAAATNLRGLLATLLPRRLRTDPGLGSSLVYDVTWGGVIPYRDASTHTSNFYGNSEYTDHHYHFGYLLYACAALAKGNETWLAENRDSVLVLIRDFANPSRTDHYFPLARMMDWWGSHSWAGGILALNDGKNQESSSEAVNAYYAVSLAGRVLRDADLTRWGQLLAAMEISAAQTYYQVPAVSTIYPAPFNAGKAVGILWNGKVDYATWFGNNPAYIHGIQYIPFTPMSEALLRKDWISESYPIAAAGLSTAYYPCWNQFVNMAQAIVDRQTAWNTLVAITGASNFYGEWAAHPKSVQLYWIATRAASTQQLPAGRRLLRVKSAVEYRKKW